MKIECVESRREFWNCCATHCYRPEWVGVCYFQCEKLRVGGVPFFSTEKMKGDTLAKKRGRLIIVKKWQKNKTCNITSQVFYPFLLCAFSGKCRTPFDFWIYPIFTPFCREITEIYVKICKLRRFLLSLYLVCCCLAKAFI